MVSIEKKSNLSYTRGIKPKRVTSGVVHLCDLAPGHRSSAEASQGCATLSDLTSQGIEPQTSRASNDVSSAPLQSTG